MVLAFGCHILGLETQDRPGRSEPPLVGSWQCQEEVPTLLQAPWAAQSVLPGRVWAE